jgi:acyl carrier protein
MMTDSDILTGLTEIFREVFDDSTLVISRTTTADDIAEWDSFNHINIIVAAEKSFGVRFKTAQLEALKNVGDFIALIESQLSRT